MLKDFHLGSLACGKHLVQALPSVFALQCLTGKVEIINKGYYIYSDEPVPAAVVSRDI